MTAVVDEPEDVAAADVIRLDALEIVGLELVDEGTVDITEEDEDV